MRLSGAGVKCDSDGNIVVASGRGRMEVHRTASFNRCHPKLDGREPAISVNELHTTAPDMSGG